MTIFMLLIFWHTPFQVLHNGQKIIYNIAPMSSAYLIPCVTSSSIESSFICKYWASGDVLDKYMTVESQTKLRGDGIVHGEILFVI